jgi:Helicase conserved C-terminal domain
VEEWADLDGQEQVEALVGIQLSALKNEQAEVALLLEAARRTEARGPDAKAEALLQWIYRLQQEETAPDLKVLIFTEFVATQEMLREFLTERGFPVVSLNGAMSLDERTRAQDAFAAEARVLVSTDAGGEGLNLQFCHVVINYDIPWNPMRLEQRIGRVDRIGQTHPVRALNFVYEDTVEYRVREVLEEKLALILDEFGVDKTGDVLDAAQAEQIFDTVYVESILNQGAIDAAIASAVDQVREQVRATHDQASLLETAEPLDPGEARRLMEHPLPYWVERMTLAYLEAYGGSVARHGQTWTLTWPGGEKSEHAVFSMEDAGGPPAAVQLTLEDRRIRDLVTRLPRFAEGQPIPRLSLVGFPANLHGYWSLWRVTLHAPEGTWQRIMPLFQHDDGRIFLPAARRVWERLLSDEVEVHGHVSGHEAGDAFVQARAAAVAHGQAIYQELVQTHRDRLAREREKGEYAFEARRRAVQRLGLPEVRTHRLAQLAQDEQAWRDRLDAQARVSPELTPLLIVRVSGEMPAHA